VVAFLCNALRKSTDSACRKNFASYGSADGPEMDYLVNDGKDFSTVSTIALRSHSIRLPLSLQSNGTEHRLHANRSLSCRYMGLNIALDLRNDLCVRAWTSPLQPHNTLAAFPTRQASRHGDIRKPSHTQAQWQTPMGSMAVTLARIKNRPDAIIVAMNDMNPGQ